MTNLSEYDLETYNTDRTRPFKITLYQLRKIAAISNCDLTPYKMEKCRKDTLVFDGDNCISKALDFLLKFKGQERKV